MENSFETFASYIDLFSKYKNNVKLLMNEQKNVWAQFNEYYQNQRDITKENYLSKYNSWLFEYIFKDVNDLKSETLLGL